jgi:hypothetical protein
MEEFLNGDPAQVFSRMRPDQRTAIAGELDRALLIANDPAARQFEADWNHESSAFPRTLSVAQVAAIYLYTREHHPELVEKVAQHPVTQAVLANASAPSGEIATPAGAQPTAQATEAELANAEQTNAAEAPALSAPDLLASAAETEATPMPEVAPGAPADEILNANRVPEPAPSPTPLPEQFTSTELAADELRAHDSINEAIAGDNPGPQL